MRNELPPAPKGHVRIAGCVLIGLLILASACGRHPVRPSEPIPPKPKEIAAPVRAVPTANAAASPRPTLSAHRPLGSGEPCPEEVVPITDEGGESWSSASTLAFSGRFAVAVCARDRRWLTDPVRERLHAEMANVVRDYHFALPFLCNPVTGTARDPQVLAEGEERRQELIERLDHLTGARAGMIRGFDCTFGWSHYDDAGEPVSGVR